MHQLDYTDRNTFYFARGKMISFSESIVTRQRIRRKRTLEVTDGVLSTLSAINETISETDNSAV